MDYLVNRHYAIMLGGEMKANMRNIMTLAVMLMMCFGFLRLQLAWADDCNISTTNKYAWSENAGWTNWHASWACVAVAPTYLTGYVWAENVGWIKLGGTGGPKGFPPQYENDSNTNWGVNRDSGTGALSGYAWSENVGWINFNPTHSQVTWDSGTGTVDGYAWGENIGWIHFQNDDPEYYVEQVGVLVNLVSFRAQGFEDFVRLEWHTATEIDKAGFHLWRGERVDGYYARITDVLIPAEGGLGWGAEYAFEDNDVVPGRTYFYELEDIDTAGATTFHGPVSAWAGVVNIQAGNRDGVATTSEEEPVSVTVAVQAGEHAGTPVECWVAAHTPFGWYTYGANGWNPGIKPAAVMPLGDVEPLEVLNLPLQAGWYTFYLAMDDLVNGVPDLTWIDAVEVEVE